MNEHEFSVLIKERDRAKKLARVLSGVQLGCSSLGIVFLIVAAFGSNPVWFLSCGAFGAISIIIGCISIYFRKQYIKIDDRLKLLQGGSGASKTRYVVMPHGIMKEDEG